MSNLLASFRSTGNALDVYQQALNVIQNNVSNSSTPAYARQQLIITARPLNLADGFIGGVASGGLQSSASAYANSEVQRQLQMLGRYSTQAQATSTIQSNFSISDTSGLPAALNNLFSSFSAWSVSPNDTTTKQSVISAAQSFASAMNGLSQSLKSASNGMDTQVASTVDTINGLAAQVQQYNVQRLKSTAPDPGADANVEAALENLSQLVNFTTVKQSDGTITVLAGGSTPLVIGTQLNKLSSSVSVDSEPPPVNPNSPPTAHILDAEGKDITGEVTGGQLGGLLDVRNRVLSSLLGDSQQAGSLNTLAKGLADTINGILQSGTVSTAAGSASGAALFTYDSSSATAAAGSLTVNPQITPDQLAPVDSSGNANGNATLLAGLADATSGTGTIDGLNFVQYLSNIASGIGSETQTASDNETTQTTVSTQAQAMRDQISGVSLDQQAVSLMQFQKGYQAVAQVLTILNSLADTTLSLIPQQ